MATELCWVQHSTIGWAPRDVTTSAFGWQFWIRYSSVVLMLMTQSWPFAKPTCYKAEVVKKSSCALHGA